MPRKITTLTCALPFLLSIAACAQGPDREGKVQLFSSEAQDGTVTSYEVDRSVLEHSPAWDPTKGDPPLPVAKAVALASKAFLAAHPKYDSANLSGVSFRRVQRHGFGFRWYYAIEFDPVIDGREMFGSFEDVILLLDGTIVPGTQGQRR